MRPIFASAKRVLSNMGLFTLTGIPKGNGAGTFTAAAAGVDYQPPPVAQPLSIAAGTVTGLTVTGTNGAKIFATLTVNAAVTTFPLPTGTPAANQEVYLILTDSGGPQSITGWNGSYRVVGTVLPATTAASKITMVRLIYSGAWLVVGVSQEQ
jgi:hypothetical protein